MEIIREEALLDDHDPEERIRQLVKSANLNLIDVINILEEEEYERQIDHFHIEKIYVDTVLKLWLDESRQKAYDNLEDDQIDIGIQMPNIWSQLDSLEFLKDIRKLDGSSQVQSWCGGARFDLIVNQSDVFETTRLSINLVSSYLDLFKDSCIDKIVSLCLKDNQQRQLIRALKKFLRFVNNDIRRQEILPEDFLNNKLNACTGQELISQLVELCRQYYQVENFMNIQLSAEKWTLQLQTLIKEICKRLLLPSTKVDYKAEGGRRLIVVTGVSVFVSKAKDEMLRLKMKHDAQEVHIVGLSSVRVDCNLEQENLHGINISVVTEKIFVDQKVCWDVSGLDSEVQLGTAESVKNSDESHGSPGEHGEPGESGGNVYVICKKIFDACRWEIKSDGGRGSDGQNGGNGSDGNDGNDIGKKRNWETKDEFHRYLPSMSKSKSIWSSLFYSPKSARQKVLEQLKRSVEKDKRRYGQNVGEDYKWGDFFIEGPWQWGDTMATVSFYDANKERHTLIFLKEMGQSAHPGRGGEGGRGGQGGFRGTIVIENLDDDLDHQLATADIVTSNRDGADGAQGVDGSGGLYGATKASDVGFMDKADKNFKPIYFGFDDDLELNLNYYEEKPSEPYVKCKIREEETVRYAKIEVVEGSRPMVREMQKNLFGRKNRLRVEAVRKKAITRQSLDQHLAHIVKRKRIIKTIGTILSPLMERQSGDASINDNLLVIENHQQEENALLSVIIVASECVTIPLTSAAHSIASTSQNLYSCVSNYSSSFQTNDSELMVVVRLKPQILVGCLKRKETTNDKTDSVIHVWEKLDPAYFTGESAEQFRREKVKSLPHETKHVEANEFTKQFVLRIKKETENLFRLATEKKQDFFEFEKKRLWKRIKRVRKEIIEEIDKPENKELKDLLLTQRCESSQDDIVNYVFRHLLTPEEYKPITKSNWAKTLASCEQKFQNLLATIGTLDKKFIWENFLQIKQWENEYETFVDLETMGWIESEMLSDRVYHLYYLDSFESDSDNNDAEIKFSYTLSPRINGNEKDERFVLYEGDGVWKRLEMDPKFKEFHEEKVRQSQLLKRHTKKEASSENYKQNVFLLVCNQLPE